MNANDLKAKLRGLCSQILVQVRHYPHNHDALRELAVAIIELLDGTEAE